MGPFFLLPLSPVLLFLSMAFFPLSIIGIKPYIESQKSIYAKPSHVEIEKRYLDHIAAPKLFEKDSNRYSAICCKDSIESNAMKFELIRAAKHCISLSGCYCGGDIFDSALDLMQERMTELPNLQIFLLSSSVWLNASNYKRLNTIAKTFSSQFHYVVYREKNLSINPETHHIKFSSNHIKALCIDYGKYFMVGGSGLQDRWATYTGVDSIESPDIPFYAKLTQNAVAPSAFRDSDFVFRCDGSDGIGLRFHVELLKTITRFQYTILTDENQLAIHFAKTPELVSTKLPAFDTRKDSIGNLQVTPYLSGPENSKSAFHEEIIKSIKSAKKSIYINHLYFHPSKRLLKAIAKASKRGVKVALVTNLDQAGAPGLHYLFASLSKKHFHDLLKRGNEDNIEIYGFNRSNVTLHKKVIIIDEKKIMTGSSNIGYVSMQAVSDYELDVVIDSESFAKQTFEVLRVDHEKCAKNMENEPLSLKSLLLAPFQSTFEFLL